MSCNCGSENQGYMKDERRSGHKKIDTQVNSNYNPKGRSSHEFACSTYRVVKEDAHFLPADSCCKFKFCKEYISTLSLICKVNEGFENACIPGNAIIMTAPVYDYCTKCCDNRKRIGKSFTFLSVKDNDCDGFNVIATAWVLFCLCDGQILFKSKKVDDGTECGNCHSFELRERCAFNYDCCGRQVTHVANDTLGLIGATSYFCKWNGCAELCGNFGLLLENGKEDEEKGTPGLHVPNQCKPNCDPVLSGTVDWKFNIKFAKKY